MNNLSDVLKPGEQVIFRLRELYRRYGYKSYKMSQFEAYDLYAENKRFLLSENVITFSDLNGQLMALKPDVTLSIVKNFKESDSLCKVYYNENVYRADSQGLGFREMMQAGLEYLGEVDGYATGEVVQLAVQSLQTVSDDYRLDFSHMGYLTGVLDAAALSDGGRVQALTCLREKNRPGMQALCRREGVSEAACNALTTLTALYEPFEKALPILRGFSVSEDTAEALDELTALYDLLRQTGDAAKWRIDFSLVNDMNYYNGLIFQGFLNGVPCAILSGGRYDRLLEKFGKSGGAIGFAMYTDLLEQLYPAGDEYDCDVLLLYDGDTPPEEINRQVAVLTADDSRVLATRNPEGIRSRRTMRMVSGGAENG